jgi:DNA (cytosine-5)-methyltransferase 1
MRTHLDLFSGIGGFALAAGWAGYQTVGFCEIEDYPRRILSKRFPGVPCHRDIRELDGSIYRGVDLITGGYPCQPFSQAGQRKGKEDDRHLWPELRRVVAQARPAFLVAENVAGHITLGLDEVLADLESEGYAGRAIVVPACAKNALHRRDRVWIIARNVDDAQSAGGGRVLRNLPSADAIQRQPQKCGQDQARQFVDAGEDVAYSEQQRLQGHVEQQTESSDAPSGCSTDTTVGDTDSSGMERPRSEQQTAGASRAGEDVADSKVERTQGLWSSGIEEPPAYAGQEVPLCGHERIGSSYWETEPAVGRVADGIPSRVDRLKGLGNAIVPQVAYEIIKELERHE